MTTLTKTDPRKLMLQHRKILRGYAIRVLLTENPLSPAKEANKARRMEEFLAIGRSFQLTERELVSLLYKELFEELP